MSNANCLSTNNTFSSIAPCLSNLLIIESKSAKVVGLPPLQMFPLFSTAKKIPSEPAPGFAAPPELPRIAAAPIFALLAQLQSLLFLNNRQI